jgi:uncharacterized membrane protein YqjE
MKMAVVAHVGGTVCAILVAWFLAGTFAREESRAAMQYAFLVAGLLWGVWMLQQTLRGQNALANRIIAIFDRSDR